MNRILAFAFVCLLIACNPTSQNKYEFLNKDAAFRTEISTRIGGSFVELSEGYTYFQEANKNSQQSTVILVHGFSVPSYIWETTYEALIEKGFHVVVLDLYGRGFSDNPDTDYTDRLMANT